MQIPFLNLKLVINKIDEKDLVEIIDTEIDIFDEACMHNYINVRTEACQHYISYI